MAWKGRREQAFLFLRSKWRETCKSTLAFILLCSLWSPFPRNNKGESATARLQPNLILHRADRGQLQHHRVSKSRASISGFTAGLTTALQLFREQIRPEAAKLGIILVPRTNSRWEGQKCNICSACRRKEGNWKDVDFVSYCVLPDFSRVIPWNWWFNKGTWRKRSFRIKYVPFTHGEDE